MYSIPTIELYIDKLGQAPKVCLTFHACLQFWSRDTTRVFYRPKSLLALVRPFSLCFRSKRTPLVSQALLDPFRPWFNEERHISCSNTYLKKFQVCYPYFTFQVAPSEQNLDWYLESQTCATELFRKFGYSYRKITL